MSSENKASIGKEKKTFNNNLRQGSVFGNGMKTTQCCDCFSDRLISIVKNNIYIKIVFT